MNYIDGIECRICKCEVTKNDLINCTKCLCTGSMIDIHDYWNI